MDIFAKFCKNSTRCSICSESHNYKECHKYSYDAMCGICKGNHIAISIEWPSKKQKIEENRNKFQTRTYANVATINEKYFPPLIKDKITHPDVSSKLNSDIMLNIIVESVVKLISFNKNNDKSTQNIKEVLIETIKNNKI
ncbi:unnamed protein product [Diatraea saccharalis]|uniref:Uncharacterized protein n=1 Tax=Diatraea saccharalis TaxID=40085 RepID=A0A9N9QUE0_9NEOP|nr:unnamed protein product [Diatraea saccharalis]